MGRAGNVLQNVNQELESWPFSERRAEPQTEDSSFGLADEKVIEQLKARFSKPQN